MTLDIEDIKRISVAPGEHIIMQLPKAGMEYAGNFARYMGEVLHCKVFVVPNEVKFSVVTTEPADADIPVDGVEFPQADPHQ